MRNLKFVFCSIIIALTAIVLSGCDSSNETTGNDITMELFGESNVIINYGNKYIDEGVLAKENDADVSESVEIISNLDINTIGEYTIEYIYKDKSLVRNISVIDTQPPKINLIGNTCVYIAVGQKYEEPGYEANDNYDGDVSQNVIIDGEVDSEAEGEYTLKYSATDSNGNETSINRQVVVKTSPLTQSLTEFTLDGLFEGTILPEHEIDYDKFVETTVMIGDSRNQSFAYYDLMEGENVWGVEGLTPFKIYEKKLLHHGTFERKFIYEMMDKYSYEIVIFTMGVECVGAYSPDEVAQEYKAFLVEFMDRYPDMKVVIHSMMPVHEKYDLRPINMWHPSNQKINNLNYHLAMMCSEMGIYFIDSTSVLKNEKGLGDPVYFTEDNVHLSHEGQEKIFQYILSHALILDEDK